MDEKDERRAKYILRQQREDEKRRLLDAEAHEREQRYLRDIGRGCRTRTSGDDREPWL